MTAEEFCEEPAIRKELREAKPAQTYKDRDTSSLRPSTSSNLMQSKLLFKSAPKSGEVLMDERTTNQITSMIQKFAKDRPSPTEPSFGVTQPNKTPYVHVPPAAVMKYHAFTGQRSDHD